jgi:anti-anti-sigma factor
MLSACKYILAQMTTTGKLVETPMFDYQPSQLATVTEKVLAVFADGMPRAVLNLDLLPRLDTDAVRGLILLLRRSREAGGEIALKVTRPELLRSLQVTALDRLFPMIQEVAA